MQIKLGLAFNYHFQIIGNFFCFSIVCDIYNLQIRSTWWHAEQHVVHVSFETATVALASARGVPSFYEAPANPSGKTKPSENFIFNLVYRHGKDGASLPGASLTRTEFVERSVDRPDACARIVRFRGNSAPRCGSIRSMRGFNFRISSGPPVWSFQSPRAGNFGRSLLG